MTWVYLAIAAVLAIIFLRSDVLLIDLLFNANLAWSGAAALFLGGILVGQWISGYRPSAATRRWAFWGVFVVAILALVEYSVEWRAGQRIAANETRVLSAASVERVQQKFLHARDGLFRTPITVNGTEAEALLDTAASTVLLTWETARAAGVDVDALTFDQPVETVSGPLTVAQVTLDSLSVGPLRLRNVTAAVSPKGQRHSNLLGASFLSRLDRVTIRGDTAILQQRLR